MKNFDLRLRMKLVIPIPIVLWTWAIPITGKFAITGLFFRFSPSKKDVPSVSQTIEASHLAPFPMVKVG